MRQIKKILMIFAVVLIFACQASANSWIDNVSVTPSQPSDTDLITFSISGGTSRSFIWAANNGQFSQNGSSLLLDLYIETTQSTDVEFWTYTKQIQPLSANNYTLEVRAFDDVFGPWNLTYTYDTGFTVTPEPSTFAIFGSALPFLRMFSRRKG